MGFPFFYTFGGSMLYRSIYSSPLGKVLILFQEESLLGLYFEGQKEFNDLMKNEEVKNFDDGKDFEIKDKNLSGESLGHDKNKVSGEKICDDKILRDTKKWLDLYFSGEEPDFTPKLKLEGTEFCWRSPMGRLLAIRTSPINSSPVASMRGCLLRQWAEQ